MNSVCIVTDATIQFLLPKNKCRVNIETIPFEIQLCGKKYEADGFKPEDLPQTISNQASSGLISPSANQIHQSFLNLGKQYNQIIGIFSSSALTHCYQYALEAASYLRGKTQILVVDSQSISCGLGFLVQLAAEEAYKGSTANEIESLVRQYIPHIYAIFSISGLSYLTNTGVVDQAQAVVSEMLDLYSIFLLEEAGFSPLEKVHNQHQVIDIFQEFLSEFESLDHIALIQGFPPNPETKPLRDYSRDFFQNSPFSDQTIHLPLSILMGPRSMGLFVVESP